MSTRAPVSLEDAMQGMYAGKSLAEQRGISSDAIAYVGTMVSELAVKGELDKALSGCMFLCTHDDSNPDWWLLYGKLLRMDRKYKDSVLVFLSGFAANPIPAFCVELAKTYLADNQLKLASEAVVAGKNIIKAEGEHEDAIAQLAELEQEVTRKQAS